MFSAKELQQKLSEGFYSETLSWLYCKPCEAETKRYTDILNKHIKGFSAEGDTTFFSAPGRSEIGGNHTDHQHGCVLAAAVTMDIVAAVSPTDDGIIRILSDGYPMCKVDLSQLEPVKSEEGTSTALIRGVAAAFKDRGYNIGGFMATMDSDVPKGSGLSSSAAYEVMVGNILNGLYNDGKVSDIEIAQIGQISENKYFGKPSGLMDQMASSVGGFVAIDFNDPAHPIVEKLDFDLHKMGYTICITNAGGSHASLTGEYADITKEMLAVSRHFGKDFLRDVNEKDFYSEIPALRKEAGDRAILRAMHFFDENRIAKLEKEALIKGDSKEFLELIKMSGASSMERLQNIYPSGDINERSVSLAISLSKKFIGDGGAVRVHGGGFAGTIQSFVPNENLESYLENMENVFGKNSVYCLDVRPVGGYMFK